MAEQQSPVESSDPSANSRTDLVEPQTLKGFQDLLPPDMILRNQVVRKIQDVYERYGFLPLDTPVLEHLATLTGAGGEETNKGMFRLKSPEDEPVAMRFDLTVPFARLIAQYPDKLPLPFRRYHLGPVFRADKPGPGRFRQFTQLDIDAAGSANVAVDAEIVAAMCDAMREVGLGLDGANADSPTRFQIRINNRRLVDALLEDAGITSRETAIHVLRVVDKLQKVGVENVRKELGDGRIDESGDRIRGVKLPSTVIDKVLAFIALTGSTRKQVTENVAATLVDSETAKAAIQQMRELADALDGLRIPEHEAIFDPSLTRGLDYYTGPVFEAWLPGAPEFGSILGGGRYDGLVTRFSDRAIPSTGASIGLDRFLAALKHLGVLKPVNTIVKVLLIQFPGMPVGELLKVAAELRSAGIPTQLYFKPDVEGLSKANMKVQLAYANAAGIPVAVLIGEDELKNNVVSIKDLGAGMVQRAEIQDREEYRKAGKTGQHTVPRGDLVKVVKEILATSGQ
jgi:histidyl-tRNA synthetase